MKTDIEIAQEAVLEPIVKIAADLGACEDDLELYGKYKAKISLKQLKELENEKKLGFKSKSDIVIYNDDNYQSLELNLDHLMRDIDMFSKNDKIFVN